MTEITEVIKMSVMWREQKYFEEVLRGNKKVNFKPPNFSAHSWD